MATLNAPYGVAVDASGAVYIADRGNSLIRRVAPGGGAVSTFAGVVSSVASLDGVGTGATFYMPASIIVNVSSRSAAGAGGLVVADTYGQRVRAVTTPGAAVTTLAGQTASGFANGVGTNVKFTLPRGLCADARGVVYTVENTNNIVRTLLPSAAVATLAGGGAGGTGAGFANGLGSNALFSAPATCALAADGATVVVTDYGNHAIRAISPAGAVTTLAGTGGVAGTANGVGTAVRVGRRHPCGACPPPHPPPP